MPTTQLVCVHVCFHQNFAIKDKYQDIDGNTLVMEPRLQFVYKVRMSERKENKMETLVEWFQFQYNIFH